MLLNIITIPGLVDRLREEIAPVFTPLEGTPSRPVRVHNLGRLVRDSPLLRSTFYEVLRTCGGTVSNRVVTEDIVVAGRLFKKGTPVMLPTRPQHLDPAIWGEDYDQFVADRFIRAEDKGGKFGNRGDNPQREGNEKDMEQRRQFKERMMRPFGGGAPLCPGRFFASYELWSFVACLIWQYDISMKDGEKIPTLNLKTLHLAVGSPTHDVKVRLVKRMGM
jgi:cytochrome P450